LEELRNTTLELVRKNPGSSGIKISKFRNGSLYLVYTRIQSSGNISLEFRN
jgi:hypothetical protein